MYIFVALLLFAVFSYYATWLDDNLNIDVMLLTVIMGVIACLAWPITLAAAAIGVPMFLIARLGAKHRGEL